MISIISILLLSVILLSTTDFASFQGLTIENPQDYITGCGPNEVWHNCRRVDPTCATTRESTGRQLCSTNCVPGCACKSGYVRLFSPRFVCELESVACRPAPVEDIICPDNEEYRTCSSCGDKLCHNLDIPCSDMCRPGCFCKPGYLRRSQGAQCIPISSCPPVPNCPANEVWSMCQNCEDRSCTTRALTCQQFVVACRAGCVCRHGFVRDDERRDEPGSRSGSLACVPESMCRVMPTCGMNERYSSCMGCTITCDDGLPEHCPMTCVPGCECKPGFVRNLCGHCVLKNQCENQGIVSQELSPLQRLFRRTQLELPQCPLHSEWHSCGPSCVPTCSDRHPMCAQMCAPGCYCNAGFVLNADKSCVSMSECEEGSAGESLDIKSAAQACVAKTDRFASYCASVRKFHDAHQFCRWPGFINACALSCCMFDVALLASDGG